MSRNLLKHCVCIAVGIGVVCFEFLLRTHPQTPEKRTPTRTRNTQYRKTVSTPQETLTDFQKSDFYRTIIDNDLFRPLGWRPPRPTETYRLLGTIIPKDGSTEAQAILQSTTARTTYIVRIADTLDKDTTLIDIQPKQVTLSKARQQRTLRLDTAPWIK